MEKKQPTPIIRSFKEKDSMSPSLPIKNTIIVLCVIALLGIGTGFVISKIAPNTGSQINPLGNIGANMKGKTFGTGDTKIFKDTAEGKLEEGGVEGEGQYHLVRPGGDSQNVYLTSSLVDLSLFLGKKIKVWGETQRAQTAGWLMDVGRVEIL